MMTYLNLGRMGRMANAMFEIAGTIGIAVQSGQGFAFPKWVNYDAFERFGSKEDIDLYKYFPNRLPEVPDIPFEEYPYFWGYRYLNFPTGNISFNSHFQSPKYFNHCMDLIRYYFTMENEPEPINAIAVHLRYGDYDCSYHPCPDPEYYKAALSVMPKDIEVHIFSDNIKAALELLNPLMNGYNLEWDGIEDGYIESFRQMKKHKHFICANSSYSMMAAILADHPDKIITAPKKWFGDHVGLETADIYPENCIII